MQPHPLVDAMAELACVATRPFEIEDVLRTLCAAAADALEVDAAGVMIHTEGRHRYVHATSERVAALEQLQQDLQQGPCISTFETGRTVSVADLRPDGRWPQYQDLAVQQDVGAMVAVPLWSRGRGWGVLDLYRRDTGPWDEDLVRAAEVLADVAVSYIVMSYDREQVQAAHQELAHRAVHDELTGLPNRALLFDRLEHALALSERTGSSVAVLFIDVDAFKAINDSGGHAAGDEVLVEVADRLRGVVRTGDTVARFAGDEFVIVCEGLPDAPPSDLVDAVRAMAERFRAALRRPVTVGTADLVVTSSIGVAVSHGGDGARRHPHDVLAEADDAMYAAKRRGRGQVSMRDLAAGQRDRPTAADLQRELGGALQRGELLVHYQPIVCTRTGDVVAAEALLRWARPGMQLLAASAFVDTAVRAGFMTDIGRWVIDQVCAQMAAWCAELGDRAPGTVYVNLSGRELTDAALPGHLRDAVDRNGLQPSAVGVEIVEDNLDDPAVLATLETFREAGHRLSVDDFGTGFSSLSRLVDFPIDVAKMDKSLIAGLPDDDRRSHLVRGVLRIAAALSFDVVAEGVESEGQAAHLRDAGCPLLQGHHVGRPQPGHLLSEEWAA